jgi:hypothetical protein
VAAREQLERFDKKFEGFGRKVKRESVGRITLREMKKRIDWLRIMRARRLKQRDVLENN